MSFNSRWSTIRLGDVAKVISGFAFKSQSFQAVGIPVIKIKNIRIGTVDLSEIEYVDDHFSYLDRKFHVKKDDLLISLTGSHLSQPNSVVGRVALYPFLKCCLLNQRAGKIIVRDSETCSQKFLFYLLFEKETRYQIALMASGAASQANISPGQVESLEIRLPQISVQHKIADILSAYDDLIENNTRRIKILEEMAQLLYCEWFVNFRFPGHENVKFVESAIGLIPEGWAGKLEDALILQRGFDLPNRDRKEGRIPIYAATGIVGTHNEVRVKAPGVVTGRSGSLGTVMYVDEDFWALNTTLWVKEFRRVTPIYAFYLLNSLGLEQYNSGAAVPTLNRNDIHKLPVIIPPSKVLEQFDIVVQSLFKLKKNLIKKNRNLRQTRDRLLPKLISGEIDAEALDLGSLEPGESIGA